MMAFEFAHPYSNGPFMHSGLPMGMNDSHGLMCDQIPPHMSSHMYNMMPPQGLPTPGPSNGSTPNLLAGERSETKPRLAKDEVARLEKIFNENHKPNSNTKRHLAEEMNVEVARINNWFQNRRAKAKQEKKQDEFEQRKLAESSAQEEQGYQQESFPENYDLEDQAHGSFSSSSGPRTASSVSCQPQYDDPTAASLASYDRVASAASTYMNEHVDLSPTLMPLPEDSLDGGMGGDRVPFPSNGWSETNFTNPNPFQQPMFQAEIEPPMNNQDPLMSFGGFPDGNELNDMNLNNNNNGLLPSQLLSPNLNQSGSHVLEDFRRHFEQQPEFIQPESSNESQYQPPSDGLRFRSPPSSANIALRRKGVRPTALGTGNTPRSNSYIGPRTATHSPTINRAGTMPLSPMRRIVSVSNLNSSYGSSVNGSRVQKSYSTSAQRSPINMKGFPDAGGLFISESYARNIKRPSLPVSVSTAQPPTPMSPQDAMLQREMTVSSSSSDDMNQLYEAGGCFMSEYGDHKQPSPPVTPAYYPTDVHTDVHNHWSNFNIPDEPLHTPGNMAFGSDIYSSWASSQPNTPGLPTYQQAPGFAYNYGHAQYGLQSSASSSNENLFHGANHYAPGFVKSSPNSNKELHFENHTAKDYEATSK